MYIYFEFLSIFGYDHTSMTAPVPVCSAKFIMLGLGQIAKQLLSFVRLYWCSKKLARESDHRATKLSFGRIFVMTTGILS